MERNTELFIEAFNRLEAAMQTRLRRPNSASFSSLVSEAAAKDPFVRRHRTLLDSFRELRNVLVHEEGNRIIAIPTDAAVRGLEKFEELYTKPDTVYELFRKKVVWIEAGQSLKQALDLMKAHGYSNLPVYHKGQCVGLLSSRVITQWLLGNYGDDGMITVDLNGITVDMILQVVDRVDELHLVSRHMDIISFLKKHSDLPSPSGIYLITENGKDTDKPLGMITEKDYVIIYNRIKVVEEV